MIFQSSIVPKLNLSKKFWISLGIILWLYFVVSSLPATWGAYLLTRSGAVAMSGVSGTLWNGRASLASIKVRGVDHSIGQFTWKLHVLSLLTLKPCAQIGTHMDGQEFEGLVCMRGKSAISVKDATASFPAALVQPLLPLAINGQFALNIERLDIGDMQLLGLRGKATWSDGKIYNGSNWMSLGGIGAELSDDGKKGLNARIFDVNSPLRLDMVGTLPFPTGATIKGTFSMPQSYFHEINAGAWLSMFATPQLNDAQGNLVYTVDLNF